MRQILTFRDILIITTIHGYQLKLCVQPQNILQGEFTVLALVLGHVFYDLTSSYKSKRTVMSPKCHPPSKYNKNLCQISAGAKAFCGADVCLVITTSTEPG